MINPYLAVNMVQKVTPLCKLHNTVDFHTGVAKTKPVSYTHLTLPTNREV